MYELIKYKTAAEIGGAQEQEVFQLVWEEMIESMGHMNYALFKEKFPAFRILKPVAQGSYSPLLDGPELRRRITNQDIQGLDDRVGPNFWASWGVNRCRQRFT